MLSLMLRAATIAGIALIAGALPASATVLMCGSHDEIAKSLDAKFKEQRSAIGLVSSTGIAELFISEQGTWTLVVTGTDMRSCVVAAGHSWETMTPTQVQSAL